MRVCRTPSDLRIALAGAPRPLGFVPTMGALHAGHAANFRRCRAECATTVASIFVNPLQFDSGEDLAAYPRTLESDRAVLAAERVDALFLPEAPALYPPGFDARVSVGGVTEGYEGAQRPGHFEGVATVVLKLFHLVAPDRAYFGRKDAQQLALVRKMARDLDLPVEVVPVDTVRDADGLALSSRNVRLSPADRQRALGLPRGLFRAVDAWRGGERDPARLARVARDPALDYDYAACVDAETFGPPRPPRETLLVAAVRVGGVRLIDNVVFAS